MEWTPVGLANLVLAHLSAFARPAALLGALAGAMLVGGVAAAGGAGVRRATGSPLVGPAVAGTCFAVVFLRLIPPISLLGEVPFVAGFVLLLALLSVSPRPSQGRREFLTRSAVVLGGAAALLALFSLRRLADVAGRQRLFAYTRPPGLPVSGLTDLVTPTDRFYRMDRVLEPPQIGISDWRLTVTGAVDRPLTLDFPSLVTRPRSHRYVTMECVDNPVGGSMIGTALWTGTQLAELLREAAARGNWVVFHGLDGYAESAPVRQLEDGAATIAYAMNGEILRREHGYPARLLLPGVYGFKSVKWLTNIEIQTRPYGGDWYVHGWTVSGRIHTMTRIDLARRVGAEILLAGIAFAGTRGIKAVQVRVNGGPWREATLGAPLARSAWVQWAMRLRGHGPATIEARAVDGTGQVQTARRHDSFPDGATGWARAVV